MVGDMADLGLASASFDLLWSEGALYNLGIKNALRLCFGLLRPGYYLFKDGRLFLSLMADGGLYEWRPAQ